MSDTPIFDALCMELTTGPVEAPTNAAEPPAKVKRPPRRKRPVKAVQA